MINFLLGIGIGAGVAGLICTSYWNRQYSKMSELCGRAIEYCRNVVNDLKDMRQVNELQAATIATQKELIERLEAKIEDNKRLPELSRVVTLLNGGKNEHGN